MHGYYTDEIKNGRQNTWMDEMSWWWLTCVPVYAEWHIWTKKLLHTYAQASKYVWSKNRSATMKLLQSKIKFDYTYCRKGGYCVSFGVWL